MRNNDKNKLISESPIRLVLGIALAVFISETVVMIIINFIKPVSFELLELRYGLVVSAWLEAFFDSSLLIILLGPVLYYFLFRPLLKNINERKRAEDALRKAGEQEYKTMLSTAMDGFWIVNTQGRIIDVNETYCRLTGYSRRELLNMGISDVEVVETHEDTVQHIRKVLEDGSDRFDTRHRCKDGRCIDVEISVTYIEADEGRFFVFLRDITERKRAEQDIRQAKEDLELKVSERTIELKQVNEQLIARASELEQLNLEAGLLSKMGEFLQTCITVVEAYSVISQTLSQLLPEDSGALFILSSSRNLLNAASTWGKDLHGNMSFHPEECWALRQGRLHMVTDAENNTDYALRCQHVGDTKGDYLCIPMIAQGETIGVLHLCAGAAESGQHGKIWIKTKKRLLLNVTEQIGLAIANLKLREALRNLAIRDPLTGLFNRRYMEESLEKEQGLAERKNSPLGIIMLDIDHFKRFNDTFGHDAGDTLLREFGGFLKQHIRVSDIACRYGGEEFTVILPEAGVETVRHRAELLREGVKNMQVQYNRELLGVITVSLGVAVFPQHGSTTQAVLQAADACLYAAKEAGRNRVCVASEECSK